MYGEAHSEDAAEGLATAWLDRFVAEGTVPGEGLDVAEVDGA